MFSFTKFSSREDYRMAAVLPESLPVSTLVRPAPAPVTYARGDGIGPEIMDTVLGVLDTAGASLALEEIRIGRQVYESGMPSGIAAFPLGK
jgi:isocitrate dehydrogenase